MRFFQGRVKPVAPAATSVVTAPTNSSLPVITGSLISGQTLSVSTGIWTNSPTSYAYQWLRSGVTVPGSTSTTYVLSSADIGAMISCTVTAINASGSASSSAAAVGPVLAVPVNSSLPAITGTFTKGQLVTVSSGAWLNSPTGFAYQWLRAGVAIVGATATGYTLVAADVGTLISCTVTATNGAGSASASAAAVGPIIDLAPANSVLPVISGTTTQGQTLSVSNGTWINGLPISYTYQWLRGSTPISGATSSTYLLASGDVGGTITCTVTAINSGGSVPATAASVGPIGSASGPALITAPSLSGAPREGEAAWLGAGEWNVAPNKYRFTLYRDGVAVTGYPVDQTGSALEFTWATADVGHTPSATVAVSIDSGVSWSSPATATLDFLFQSDLITPATIAAPTIVRTSTSGDVNLIYRIDAPALYNSYIIRQQRYTHAGAFVEQNYIAVSESGLGSLTINTSAASDPAPYPAPLGTLATDDIVRVSIQSADYEADGSTIISGVTSPTTDVNVSDVVSAMTWSTTDNAVPSGTPLALSNGNLTVTDATSGTSGIRANRAVAFDKTYWEVSGSPVPNIIAVADASAPLTTGWGATAESLTPTTHAVSNTQNDGGIISYNGSRTASSVRTATDIGCIALDRVALKAWFGHISGGVTTWYNGSPSAGTGGEVITGIGTPLYPAAQLLNGNVATLNPGTTPGGTAGFTGTVPTGFLAP